MRNSFYFVLNPLRFDGECPHEIIPGHFLQQADKMQIALIGKKLDGFSMLSHWLPSRHLGYNCDWVPYQNETGKETAKQLVGLPEQDWRYWVINFDGQPPHKIGDDSTIGKLQCSANLLENDWDIGFGFLYAPEPYGPAFVLRNNLTFTFLEAHKLSNKPVDVTANALGELRDIFSRSNATELDQPEIYRVAQRFSALKSLPRHSELVILGLFSIIEALVTHAPQPREEYDSLNHQISAKMTLLSKRFERQLDYDGYFGQLDREKVWKQLYAYRSSLAHGTSPDFKKQLKSLKDANNALEFLKDAAKLTLLFAMKGPEFLADLKKC